MFFGILPSCCHRILEYLALRTRHYFRIGSDEEVIQNLPVYLFNSECNNNITDYEISGRYIFIQHSKSNCIICFDDYSNGEEIKLLPCGHFYHNKCINSWLKISQTCPLCRRNIITNNYSEEEEEEEEEDDGINNELNV